VRWLQLPGPPPYEGKTVIETERDEEPMAGIVETVVGLGSNADLLRYSRWEYGADVTGWLVAAAQRHAPEERPWLRRLRYWLNSFRGFAPFDTRGIDDRVRG